MARLFDLIRVADPRRARVVEMVGTTTMSPADTTEQQANREAPTTVGTAAVRNRGATVAEIVAEEEVLRMVVVIVVLCSVITATKLATRHVIVQIVPPVVAGKTDRSAALVR